MNASVDFGRWLADCPDCNGAEYVDPDEPVFFCLSCGNEDNNHQARPVVFPEDKKDIESDLLKQPVKRKSGFMAFPQDGKTPRSWRPE